MRKRETYRATEYSLSECCMRLIRSLVAFELLYCGVCLILRSSFPHWVLSRNAIWWMQLILVGAIVANELMPILGRRYMIKIRVLCEIVLLGWLCFETWRIRKPLWKSFHAWFDDYLPYWNAYNGTDFAPYNEGGKLGYALAFTVLMMIVCVVILRYVSECRIFLVLPNVAAVGSALLVNVRPDAKSLLLSFAGVMVLYSGGWEAGKAQVHARIGRQKRVGRRIGWQLMTTLVTVVAVGGIICVTFIGFRGLADRIPAYGPKALDFQLRAEDWLLSLVGFGSSPSYDKNKATLDNGKPEYRDVTIATVYSDQQPQGNLYLKAFCSASYEDGTWKAPDRSYEEEVGESLSDSTDFAKLLQQTTYEKLKQDSVKGPMKSEYGEVEGRMRIDYENSHSRSALLPYFWDPSSSDASLKMDQDAVWRKGNESSVEFTQCLIAGTKLFGYEGMYAETGDREYEDGEAWYCNFVLQHDMNGSSEIPMIRNYKDRVTYALQDTGQLSDDEEKSTCERVREKWSDWGKLFDASYWAGVDTSSKQYKSYTNNLARNAVAREVRNQLFSDTEYNLYLDELPAGTDPIEYFLRTSKEGYCMHYASAATLILQELGVPARYASGFVVKPGLFQLDNKAVDLTKSYVEKNQYVATVKDYCAHAWVEIYMDGIGWVPYEMTPGYAAKYDVMPTDGSQDDRLKQRHEENRKERQQPESEQPSEVTTERQVIPQNTQMPQEKDTSSQTPEKATKPQQAGKNYAKAILLVCLCILFAGIVWYGGSRLIHNYQQKLVQELRAKRNRNAVKRMNRRIYRGLMGGRAMTDAEYESRLVKAYPSIAKSDWKHYMEIVKKCAFSHEVITDEEAEFCYRIYKGRGK